MGAATEVDTATVIAEHRRIERIVSSMKAGDTAVINGCAVVAISLAEDMSAADRRAHDLASYVRPKAGA